MNSSKSLADYSSAMKDLPPEIKKKAIEIADRLIKDHVTPDAAVSAAIKAATEVTYASKPKLNKTIMW